MTDRAKLRAGDKRKKATKKLRNKKFVDAYKKKRSCQICGETRPICLLFHHVKGDRDKEANIADLVKMSRGLKRIAAEMSKCIVVCLNCHRVIHSWDNDTVAPI